MTNKDDSWVSWSKHVLIAIEQQREDLRGLQDDCDEIKTLLNNHVTHLSNDISTIKATMKADRKNRKWVIGILTTLLIGLTTAVVGVFLQHL